MHVSTPVPILHEQARIAATRPTVPRLLEVYWKPLSLGRLAKRDKMLVPNGAGYRGVPLYGDIPPGSPLLWDIIPIISHDLHHINSTVHTIVRKEANLAIKGSYLKIPHQVKAIGDQKEKNKTIKGVATYRAQNCVTSY